MATCGMLLTGVLVYQNEELLAHAFVASSALRGHKPETQIGAGPRLSESFGICCAAQGELRHGGWVGGWVVGWVSGRVGSWVVGWVWAGRPPPPPRNRVLGHLSECGGWVGGWVGGGCNVLAQRPLSPEPRVPFRVSQASPGQDAEAPHIVP